MGEVLQFAPRPKKLTGFLPRDLGARRMVVVRKDPLVSLMTPFLFWGAVIIGLTVFFAEGWRER